MSQPGPMGFSGVPIYPAVGPQGDQGNMSVYPPAQGYPPNQPPGYPPSQQPSYPPGPGYPSQPSGYPSGQAGGFGPGSPPGNTQIFPSGPTAPSLDQVEKVPGYEHVTFNDEIITPPVAPGWEDKPPPQRENISGVTSLSKEDVQDAVMEYTTRHCCYGKTAAKDMDINDIRMNSVFHYILETFGEKRESAWKYDPYNGEPIDGPMNGPAPGPWEIMASPPTYFKGSQKKIEVPHTAFVKPCHTCVGNGRVRCDDCQGMGQKHCTWCNGSGRRFDNACNSCNSSGRDRCSTCSATGQVKCKTCQGKGQLKGYVQLTITWTNHYVDYITETSNLPPEKIRSVTGNIVFQEEQPRVWPITHTADHKVNQASQDLVRKHSQEFPNERILKQKHSLRIVPVAEIDYEWKDKGDQLYVYGFENEVYFPNKYPQNCCWGCTIL